MKYYVRVGCVPVGKSGLVKQRSKFVLTLDVSYHDKCGLDYIKYIDREKGELSKDDFYDTLQKAKRYNRSIN